MNNSKIPFLVKTTFLFEGIASLIGWNAVQAAFDFFAMCYPSYNVSFTLILPMSITETFLSLFVFKISRYMSLNSRIYMSLGLLAIILVILPLISNFIRTISGYIVCEILMVFIGVGTCLMYNTAIAFASIFPSECINVLFSGVGFSGVVIAVFRMIILGIFGNDPFGYLIGVIVYFTISGIFSVLTLILHFWFRKTEFCIHFMKLANNNQSDEIILEQKHENKENNKINFESNRDHLSILNDKINIFTDAENNITTRNSLKILESDQALELEKKNLNNDNILKTETQETMIIRENTETHVHDSHVIMHKNEKYSWKFIVKVFKKIHPFPFLCWFTFTQTFLMFPAVTLKKQLSFLSFSMSSTLLILIFSVGETVGTYMANYLSKKGFRMIFFFLFLRFISFPLYFLTLDRWNVEVIREDWLAILNTIFFSSIFGFVISNVMIGASMKADNNEKETSGFIMSFFLKLGILTGSLFALFFMGF